MEIRFQNSPKETSQMDTQQLRENFLVEEPNAVDDTFNWCIHITTG